jgi:hypothetical protein
MPANERALFILLGYAANQLNLFSKLTILSLNNTTDEMPEALFVWHSVTDAFAHGDRVIHEVWVKVITARVVSSPLGKYYIPRLNEAGKQALDALNKLFDKNILSSIRNNYAFHHPYDADINAAFEQAASDAGGMMNGTGFSLTRTTIHYTRSAISS